jgi:DAK2 domain fusion protein YloV
MLGSVSAADLRSALVAALQALRARRAQIDALNVFPVADADTGTNLVATFDAVVRASAPVAGDGEIARAVRGGSLMGARGNSGVIVAQVLKAWADAVEAGPADGDAIGRAFKRAVEYAYDAVLEPAEGTILTVLRAASDGAQAEGDPGARFERAARESVAALALTRTINPVLARAGVVDAGGAGLAIALSAMAESFGARAVEIPPLPSARAWLCEDRPSFAYEVMYSLRADEAAIAPLRRLLGTIGDSVVVIGGGSDWRVHVHTDEKARAVALGDAVGETADVQIVSFEEQIAGARGVGLSRAASASALVAVANGDGLQALFRDLGAHVVSGAADLRAAIESAPTTHVIVLPDGDATRAAATALAAEIPKTVTVLPVPDPAAALAAAVAFGDARTAAENLADMREALAGVRTAATDGDPLAAAARLLAGGPAEVLTVICGAGVSAAERETLRAGLAAANPEVAVEIHDGGQGASRFLLAAE